MNSVIIFDVSQNAQDAIRISMVNRGYFNFWNGNGIIYTLPQNTVWKPNNDLQQAYSDLYQVIAQANSIRQPANQIVLTRCIVLNSTPWVATEKPVIPIPPSAS